MTPHSPCFGGTFNLKGKLISKQALVVDLSSMSFVLRPIREERPGCGAKGEGRQCAQRKWHFIIKHRPCSYILSIFPFPLQLCIFYCSCFFLSLSLPLSFSSVDGSPSPAVFPQGSALGNLFHMPPSAQITIHNFVSTHVDISLLHLQPLIFNEHQLCLSTASGYFCMKILFQLPIEPI